RRAGLCLSQTLAGVSLGFGEPGRLDPHPIDAARTLAALSPRRRSAPAGSNAERAWAAALPQCFRRRFRSVFGGASAVFSAALPQCFRRRFRSVFGGASAVFSAALAAGRR